jgi:hypothetical protein
MENVRLHQYIMSRLEQLDKVDTSKSKDLENQITGRRAELLKFSKMLINCGVVRTMTKDGIKEEKY